MPEGLELVLPPRMHSLANVCESLWAQGAALGLGSPMQQDCEGSSDLRVARRGVCVRHDMHDVTWCEAAAQGAAWILLLNVAHTRMLYSSPQQYTAWLSTRHLRAPAASFSCSICFHELIVLAWQLMQAGRQ